MSPGPSPLSAHIRLSCDRDFREGRCPNGTAVFGVGTLDEARQLAARHGWHRVEGKDRCPPCAGSSWSCPAMLRPPT
jgi:hypothetical protein